MGRRPRESRSSSISKSSSNSSSTYDSSPRDRDYRAGRSRSRSRSRGRSRYDRRRSPKRRRERSRSPFSRRRSPCDSKPSNKVILTSLPSYVDKDVLNILLARQGYHPIDIRVVRRNTDSGSVRVFGFIEFANIYTAEDWMNFNQGFLKLDDGFQVRLEYSREEAAREKPTYNPLASDWNCSKCTINNFNRRTNCFKCGTSRQESDAMEAKGYAMVGVSPSDTLLIRELPITASEESIRSCLAKYTKLTIQRILISSSKLYAFVQMRSSEEAGYILQTFNKTVPYIDNCAVIVTYSRQSLNQILILENVNILKSQSGISSSNINEDPTNSAAQLAQNAIRIANMGRATPSAPAVSTYEVPPRQSVSTPFGYLPIYEVPDPKSFQFEPSSGYYYDSATGFYFDPKTQYYFNTNTNHWMFWSNRYSSYIDCHGGDEELKNKLLEEERAITNTTESCSVANLPEHPSDETNKQQTSLETHSSKTKEVTEEVEKIVKRKRKHIEEDEGKQKTPQEIQKEMEKWARRQDKIKMSFKQNQTPSIETSVEQSIVSNTVSKSITQNVKESQLEPIKKPWVDDDDDGSEVVPADAILPGRIPGVTHRLARVRMARAELVAGLAVSSDAHVEHSNDHQQPSSGKDSGVAAEYVDEHSFSFDETKYIDQTKKSCLLCRRQFPDVQTLDKHVKISNLHKTNVMKKVKEIQADNACSPEYLRYRDRARERRSHFGYDPGLSDKDESSNSEITHEVAAAKASKPLDCSNVGNRMLKSMGWSEGHGLGRNLQGIVQPIQAEQHVQGVGLGSSGSKIDVNASWKDRNRRSAIQRFNDLHDT